MDPAGNFIVRIPVRDVQAIVPVIWIACAHIMLHRDTAPEVWLGADFYLPVALGHHDGMNFSTGR